MLKRLTKACRGAGRARRSCAKRATRAAISMLHGWAADARSCSLVLVPFACAHCIPARFTSSRCLLEFPVGRMTPLACRAALAPAVTAAPFLPRFVFLPKLIQRAMKADADAAIKTFGKNEQVKKVFWTMFVSMAGLIQTRVLDPVTAQQVVGVITGMGE